MKIVVYSKGLTPMALAVALGAAGDCAASHIPVMAGTHAETVLLSSEPPLDPETEKKLREEEEPETGPDPVQFYNGCFVRTEEPVRITSRGMDTALRFTYRSQSCLNGSWGFGWHFNCDQRLRFMKDGDITLVNGEGDKILYARTEPMRYVPPAGVYDEIWETPEGTFVRWERGGRTHHYALDGTLSRIEDRNGNAIVFSYDPAGKLPITGPSRYFINQETGVIAREYRLTAITDTAGRELSFTYDPNGRLSVVGDFAGRVWSFGYDARGNRTSLTTPATARFPSGLTTTYAYEDPLDPHNLTSITDPEGQLYLVNRYDARDCVVGQTYGGGTCSFAWGGAEAPCCTYTDRRGTEILYRFDPYWNIIEKRVYEAGGGTWSTAFAWNDRSERTGVTWPRGNGAEFVYDDWGNVTTMRRRAVPGSGLPDIVTTASYEPAFLLPKTVTDPRDGTTVFTYDYEDPEYGTYSGNLMKVQLPETAGTVPEYTFTYDEYGQRLSQTDPNGIVTSYEYDDDTGRIMNIIRDAGGLALAEEFGYDVYGNLAWAKDARGFVTDFEADALGLVAAATDPLGGVTGYLYDGNRNVSRLERATGDPSHPLQTSRFTYTALDRLASARDDLLHGPSFAYDANDNLIRAADADGRETVYAYDERDLPGRVTDAKGGETVYSRDENGNLIELADPRGNRTRFDYDGHDRLITVTRAFGTALAFVERFGYDAAGDLVSRTTRGGETIAYERDALGRLAKKTLPGGSAIGYIHDPGGRLTDVVSSTAGSIHFTYDGADRITAETAEGRTVGREYDANGNTARVNYPGGGGVILSWDAMNRLDLVTDAAGGAIADYGYDALGRRVSIEFGNGTRAEYAWDFGDRLTSLAHTRVSPATTLALFSYPGYDNAGNLTGMARGADASLFGYDALCRLTGADYAPGTFPDLTYGYDAAGNRTGVADGGTVAYAADALNRYSSVGGVEFSYDANGNLASDGGNTFTYDCENRLVGAATPGGTYTYLYDALGRRVGKTGPGTDVRYVWDGARVVEERDAGDAVTASYVYGGALDECLRMTRGGAGYYYHGDRLGSVAALSDASGALAESYAYEAFGGADSRGAAGNAYFFTGRPYDPETGLYDYRARCYSPALGRFLQPDAPGARGPAIPETPQDANLYAYVRNNPLNHTDPSGRDAAAVADMLRSFAYARQAPDLGPYEVYDQAVAMAALGAAAAVTYFAANPYEKTMRDPAWLIGTYLTPSQNSPQWNFKGVPPTIKWLIIVASGLDVVRTYVRFTESLNTESLREEATLKYPMYNCSRKK